MRMLVLGGGQQGSACAYDLLQQTEHEVVLADLSFDRLPDFLRPHLGRKLTTEQVDATNEASLRKVVEGADAVMSALPYYLNLDASRIAVEAGAHFCDLGGNTEIVQDQKQMADRARAKGVSVIPDCGLAPGMVNILAEMGIRALDKPRAVRIKVGGLPQNPEPPLNYQIVYSLEGVLDYYDTLSWILRDGRPQQVEAMSEREELEFPTVGRLEAFHTAGGLSLMAQRYEGKLESMEYKTLRYPGHAELMNAIKQLGLFDLEPIDVKGIEVVPRDVFVAAVGPRLRKDPAESPDLVALRVEVEGERDGTPQTLRWDLVDRFDPETGITAMMRCTGYSLAITGLLQAEGRIEPGVWTPDEAMPGEEYVKALRSRGVDIRTDDLAATAAA